MAGVTMGICLLAYCIATLAVEEYTLHFQTEMLKGLTFITVMFGSQSTIYAIRQHRRLWGSRPSIWLTASSIVGILIAAVLAVVGIAMAPLPVSVVAGTFVAALVLVFVLGLVKIPVFGRLKIV